MYSCTLWQYQAATFAAISMEVLTGKTFHVCANMRSLKTDYQWLLPTAISMTEVLKLHVGLPFKLQSKIGFSGYCSAKGPYLEIMLFLFSLSLSFSQLSATMQYAAFTVWLFSRNLLHVGRRAYAFQSSVRRGKAADGVRRLFFNSRATRRESMACGLELLLPPLPGNRTTVRDVVCFSLALQLCSKNIYMRLLPSGIRRSSTRRIFL